MVKRRIELLEKGSEKTNRIKEDTKMEIVHVTDQTFEEEVLKADSPVLVDFWAGWCGPCKMLAPILEEVANETEKVKICKVDVDENPTVSLQYNIMSIPTILMFSNGIEEERSIGLLSKPELLDLINKIQA